MTVHVEAAKSIKIVAEKMKINEKLTKKMKKVF
jgi:hypothetical protein